MMGGVIFRFAESEQILVMLINLFGSKHGPFGLRLMLWLVLLWLVLLSVAAADSAAAGYFAAAATEAEASLFRGSRD